MFRYARADLRRGLLLSIAVVAGFTVFTGYVVPAAGALLKAFGL